MGTERAWMRDLCYEKGQPAGAQLLSGFEITMRTLDVFRNLGTVIGKSDDLSVSLGK